VRGWSRWPRHPPGWWHRHPVATDLTDDDSLASLLARTHAELGPVDVLVNNAGYAVWKPPEATSMAEWDRTFAVNVRAAAWLCAAVLPGMQARGFGRIINLGSEAGVAIVPGLAAYCYVIHGADPASFLQVDEVVDVVASCCTPATMSSWARRSWSAPCATP
jgi:short-subunit dehydrogenase involved in D-alanine esterification of teichoic acids